MGQINLLSHSLVSLILLLPKIYFQAKEASAKLVDTGREDKHTFENCGPVSVLNMFFKITELSVFDKVNIWTNEFLSVFMVTYCKHYGTQHMLIRLLEERRANFDQNKIIGTVLLDLSKAFDYNFYMMILRVITLNYFKNQIKPPWQLKDLSLYLQNFTKH